MEQIIKKAQEGGMILDKDFIPTNGEFCILICNSSFWQALGKSCGWDEEDNHCDEHGNKSYYWKEFALRFHEINLTESWENAVSYLSSLIK